MTPEQKTLLAHAQAAAASAYAPYSRFRVGAAVQAEKGIFAGANIENACTNLGICAERVAMAHARMNQAGKISGIAVCCVDAANEQMTMPCGACRQWMAELAPDAWIITNGSDRVYRVSDLLPVPFKLKNPL